MVKIIDSTGEVLVEGEAIQEIIKELKMMIQNESNEWRIEVGASIAVKKITKKTQ